MEGAPSQWLCAPEPELPVPAGDDETLGERVDEALAGFAER